VFEKLNRDDRLKLEIPFGDFTLRESDKPILFVAGSTGFAPIKSIIEDMFIKGIVRDTTLYWGARTLDGLYSELPRQWAKEYSHFKYVPVISDTPEPGILHNLVHKAVLDDHPRLAGYQAYACGVPVMTQAAQREFLSAGLPADEFFADAFVTRAEVASAGP
jgi:NAD(P)H-flavin reductase